MRSSLVLVANLLVIVGSVGWFWMAWRYSQGRSYMLLGVGSLISGLSWFLPSESARALVSLAAAALLMPVVVALMIRTWRQASIHQ